MAFLCLQVGNVGDGDLELDGGVLTRWRVGACCSCWWKCSSSVATLSKSWSLAEDVAVHFGWPPIASSGFGSITNGTI